MSRPWPHGEWEEEALECYRLQEGYDTIIYSSASLMKSSGYSFFTKENVHVRKERKNERNNQQNKQ